MVVGPKTGRIDLFPSREVNCTGLLTGSLPNPSGKVKVQDFRHSKKTLNLTKYCIKLESFEV